MRVAGGGSDTKQSGQGEPEGIICGKVSVLGRGATGDAKGPGMGSVPGSGRNCNVAAAKGTR